MLPCSASMKSSHQKWLRLVGQVLPIHKGPVEKSGVRAPVKRRWPKRSCQRSSKNPYAVGAPCRVLLSWYLAPLEARSVDLVLRLGRHKVRVEDDQPFEVKHHRLQKAAN